MTPPARVRDHFAYRILRRRQTFQFQLILALWSACLAASLLGPGDIYRASVIYDVVRVIVPNENDLGAILAAYACVVGGNAVIGRQTTTVLVLIVSAALWVGFGSVAIMSSMLRAEVVSGVGLFCVLLGLGCPLTINAVFEDRWA